MGQNKVQISGCDVGHYLIGDPAYPTEKWPVKPFITFVKLCNQCKHVLISTCYVSTSASSSSFSSSMCFVMVGKLANFHQLVRRCVDQTYMLLRFDILP